MREPKCPIAGMVCPRNSDPAQGRYCPSWTEVVEENPETGDTRVTRDCLFRLMPRMMVEVIKASNRPAAEVSEARCEIVKGFSQVADIMTQLHQAPRQLTNGEDREP